MKCEKQCHILSFGKKESLVIFERETERGEGYYCSMHNVHHYALVCKISALIKCCVVLKLRIYPTVCVDISVSHPSCHRIEMAVNSVVQIVFGQ